MTLTSLPFVLFTAAVLVIYNLVPERGRWLVLLGGSYFFYACFNLPYLLLTLLAVTSISYLGALRIAEERSPEGKRIWLWSGIVLNLLFLIGLKYIPFLTENANLLLKVFGSTFQLSPPRRLVSIGVSYYVFQGISYLIDIYLEMEEPERHFGRFALSISLFPKLLQGPIERGGKLLPQLRHLSRTSRSNLAAGINLFIWGLFKKVVIADRLAALVDPVYNNVTGHSGWAFVIATYLFAFQIYFDFSGYTDMALGVARCFNIELTQNFNAPYLARSTADFWRRWHISFSSWILDYIFKPLQFSFRSWPRLGTPLALIITFLASGIWHGASWCFVIWGLLHGCYVAGGALIQKRKQKLYKTLGIAKSRVLAWSETVITFHLVCFAWIFFRAARLSDAFYIVRHSVPDLAFSANRLSLYGSVTRLVNALLLLAVAGLVRSLDMRVAKDGADAGALSFMVSTPLWLRSGCYGLLSYMIVLCGANTQSFIYMQF